MPLVINEEQSLLRDSARGFLAKNAPVSHLRKLRDSRDKTGFSSTLWKQFAEMGFAGILVPENLGGSGLGYVEAGIVMEELGRTLTPSPFLGTALLCVTALVRAGSEAQKKEYLPKIAMGERIGAFAVDEHSKHNPRKIALSAKRSGNGFVLNGTKGFVVDGHVADFLMIAARTAGEPDGTNGLTLFLLDPKTKGIEIERTMMVDSHNAARVKFDNAQVNADAVLGEVDGGWKTIENILNVGRAAVAAELSGAGEEAFERTVTYLKDRKQFGRKIGEFQALQHRAAHLYSEIEITKAAVLKALQTLDEHFDHAGMIVSVAKARACASATLAVQEAVQMHGGIGMTDEFDIGFFMKRVRVAQELFGDANFHADQLARLNRY
jgi:alkylation response protein AidB-like acyl-CoA dehydrogenase